MFSSFGSQSGSDQKETADVQEVKWKVGDQVNVYWAGDDKWFNGIVAKTRGGDSRNVLVKYDDDNEEHWENSEAVHAQVPQIVFYVSGHDRVLCQNSP